MKNDPIIDEVRGAGQAYVASFKGDRRALLADLKRRERESQQAGHQVVALVPRPPRERARAN